MARKRTRAGKRRKNPQQPAAKAPRPQKQSAAKAPPAPAAVPPADADAGAGYLLADARPAFGWRGLTSAAQTPLALVARNWKVESLHMAAVFALVVALYAYTAPRVVAFEDDGLFLMNMHYFGVAHPPGYPLHTILGGIFYHLMPWGTPAFKGHLFSGVVGALTCSGVYASVALLTRGRLPAYAAALAYGVSMTFWSQAIIAEVYTLNTMMFFLVLALVLQYASYSGRADSRGHRRLMCAVALCYGLGLSNHWVLLGIGSLGFAVLVTSQLRHILRSAHYGVLFLLLGLLPYAWMVVRSWQDVPVSFYGSIDTLDNFIFYVSRSGYSGVDDQVGVDIDTKIKFFDHLFTLMAWQFTPLGAVLAALGVWAMARSCHLWVFLAFLLSWFMSSVFLVLMINFKAEYIWLTAFRVYPLVAYGIMAIWLGYGVAWLADRMPKAARGWPRACAAAAAGAGVVAASVFAHWEENNRKDYRWAHEFAMFKLSSLEENTEFFTFDDLDVPVGYLHYVEGVRPDINVYNDQGLVFGNRLYSPLVKDADKIRRIREFVAQSGDRPVYYHPLRTSYFKNEVNGSDLLGFFRRVNKDGPEDRVILDDRLRQWLGRASRPDDSITDLWTRHQRYTIVATLTHTLLLATTAGYAFDESWQEVLDRAMETNVLARISAGLTRFNYGLFTPEQAQAEWEWTEGQKSALEEEVHLDNKGKSHFYLLRALLSNSLQVDATAFEENLRRSIEASKELDNPSLSALLDHYARADRQDEFLDVLSEYYPDEKRIPERFRRIQRGFLRAQGAQAP